jgi:hypothetical protein
MAWNRRGSTIVRIALQGLANCLAGSTIDCLCDPFVGCHLVIILKIKEARQQDDINKQYFEGSST